MIGSTFSGDSASKQKIRRLARWSIMVALAIMGLKFIAWWMTGSVALYSDALESIVNVIAAAVALWAITLSHKPADSEHQFGHHKAEYVSAVLEGVLIVVAAMLIIAESWRAWQNPAPMTQAWGGLAVNGFAAVLNLFWAQLLIRVGTREKSPALEADGHHIMTDVVTSVGVIAGLVAAVLTGWSWLDPLLALVCGNPIVWKPSEKTPLTALACQAILDKAIARFGSDAPANLSTVLNGERVVGEALVDHPKVALVSATGSTRMGREVGPRLAKRFARSILELGGNNAGIVCPTADLDMALRAIAFGAMGTAGQRCTTLRRLIVHESVYDALVPRLKRAYESVSVGNPLETSALVGPLIDKAAYEAMQKALEEAQAQGGVVTGGERITEAGSKEAWYVRPALVEMPSQTGPVLQETFAPILYVMKYKDFDEAIALHNGVAAGLSSSIFTLDMREAELFLSAQGSDCGIANVNIGTSGAEIGGAFGGEKETGGGRESGSDAWKAYMRRATNTVNYSTALPLAQGVSFDIE